MKSNNTLSRPLVIIEGTYGRFPSSGVTIVWGTFFRGDKTMEELLPTPAKIVGELLPVYHFSTVKKL